MKNIKGLAVATDGNLKRMAITYDEIEESSGKVVNSNVKMNRVITDETVLASIKVVEEYAYSILATE